MSFGDNFPVCHSLILFTASLVSWFLKQQQLNRLVVFPLLIIKLWHMWWPSLFYRHFWPWQKINISSVSKNTHSIYMNTVSASRITQTVNAATLLSFYPCFCYSDSSHVTLLFVNSVSTSLLLTCSFYYKLCSLTIVCTEAAFCIEAFILPSHLTIYCLLKAHQPILK